MAVFATATVAAVSQRDILSNLTASYDASMRPGQALEGSCAAEAAPDRVNVETDVSVIHTINQVSKSYRLDGYLIASWSDHRLVFDASCQRLHFGAMKDLGIWAPQLNFPHARSLTVGGGSGKMAADGESVYIHPDGKVDWIRAMHVEMYCGGFSFGKLPYDIQYCDFSIASLGSSPQDLELYWLVNNEMLQMKVDADPFTSGEWAAHPVSRQSNQSIPILGIPPALRNPLGATCRAAPQVPSHSTDERSSILDQAPHLPSPCASRSPAALTPPARSPFWWPCSWCSPPGRGSSSRPPPHRPGSHSPSCAS